MIQEVARATADTRCLSADSVPEKGIGTLLERLANSSAHVALEDKSVAVLLAQRRPKRLASFWSLADGRVSDEQLRSPTRWCGGSDFPV